MSQQNQKPKHTIFQPSIAKVAEMLKNGEIQRAWKGTNSPVDIAFHQAKAFEFQWNANEFRAYVLDWKTLGDSKTKTPITTHEVILGDAPQLNKQDGLKVFTRRLTPIAVGEKVFIKALRFNEILSKKTKKVIPAVFVDLVEAEEKTETIPEEPSQEKNEVVPSQPPKETPPSLTVSLPPLTSEDIKFLIELAVKATKNNAGDFSPDKFEKAFNYLAEFYQNKLKSSNSNTLPYNISTTVKFPPALPPVDPTTAFTPTYQPHIPSETKTLPE